MTQTQDQGIGALFEIFLGLGTKMDRYNEWRIKHGEAVFQQPVTGQLSGNGTLDNGPPQMGPPREHCWSIRWLSITGFSAGSVALQINGMEPYYTVTPTVNGWNKMGRGELLLQPGDRITLTATGITGSVLLMGRADTFPYWHLPKYLD